MNWEQLGHLADLYGPTGLVVLSTVGIIAFLWKAWPVIRKFVESVNTVAALPDTLSGMQKSLSRIEHEVFPNSGQSMRDAVNRTEMRSRTTEGKVDSVEQKVDELVLRFDHHLEVVSGEHQGRHS